MFPKKIQFRSNKYEEWQAGQCISHGPIDVLITLTIYLVSGRLDVQLTNVRGLKIIDSFSFEKMDILPDMRMQFVHGSYDFNPIIPYVCHIFYSVRR